MIARSFGAIPMERKPNYEELKAAHAAALPSEDKEKSPEPTLDPFERLNAKYDALNRENEAKLEAERISRHDFAQRQRQLDNEKLVEFRALEKAEAKTKAKEAAAAEAPNEATVEKTDRFTARAARQSQFSDITRPVERERTERPLDTGRERE